MVVVCGDGDGDGDGGGGDGGGDGEWFVSGWLVFCVTLLFISYILSDNIEYRSLFIWNLQKKK